MTTPTLGSLCLVAVTACGFDPGTATSNDASANAPGIDAPGAAGNTAGSGTGTLVVSGTVAATPGIQNSADPTSFTTDFTIDVTRAGAMVTTGSVSVASAGGAVDLVFDSTAMHWRGAQAGYAAAYSLDVTSGSDSVVGVRVAGPDIHAFTAPTAGATVDSTLPLPIAWARTDPAAAATLTTRSVQVAIPDTGTFTLGANKLRSKSDQVENEQLTLVRSDQITPAGGAVGSTFQVSVSNSIDLLVQPTGGGD